MNDPSRSTRDDLIAAGRQLFARRGYDGASIRAITERADANLGAVTYHFGSKKALYEAVLDRVLGGLGGSVQAAVSGTAGSSLDRLGAGVRAIFGYLEENRDLPQLFLQEVAAGREPPPPVARLLQTMLTTLSPVLAEGQAHGEVREGDPDLLMISCIIQPVHLTLVRRWLHHVKGMDIFDSADRETVVEHTVAFARAGVAARKEDDA